MATWVTVARVSELEPGRGKVVTVGERTLALFLEDGVVRAFDNACPHRGAPLAEGILRGERLICAHHGWGFDVETGEALHDPTARVTCYRAVLEGDEVRIELP
jgi:nitrite reductase/ring-hydroxylating ferredoxin subunit